MDRLAQLIGKLKEQFEQNADPSQLLATTQLIEAELVRSSALSRKTLSTSKVAVVMPVKMTVTAPEPAVQEAVTIPDMQPVAVNGNGAYPPDPQPENGQRPFDPLTEIPTLAHQQSVKELNEAIATGESSLNDKLKTDRVEVGHVLNGSPVRDLKKAIGVNDRYIFINELFRGDETMYERSIKTINSFHIFQEAQYWIERELKLKLGWDESNKITEHFCQLVRRRFS